LWPGGQGQAEAALTESGTFRKMAAFESRKDSVIRAALLMKMAR